MLQFTNTKSLKRAHRRAKLELDQNCKEFKEGGGGVVEDRDVKIQMNWKVTAFLFSLISYLLVNKFFK